MRLFSLTYPAGADHMHFIPQYSPSLTTCERMGLTPVEVPQSAAPGFRKAGWLIPSATGAVFARICFEIR